MITYQQDETAGIAELTIEGKISRADFEAVAAQLGPLMEARGRVGILKHIVSFGGIAPTVLWDDLKFGLSHLKHVGAVAVVSERRWIEIWTKLASPFMSAEVRFFEPARRAEARAWLESELRGPDAES